MALLLIVSLCQTKNATSAMISRLRFLCFAGVQPCFFYGTLLGKFTFGKTSVPMMKATGFKILLWVVYYEVRS